MTSTYGNFTTCKNDPMEMNNIYNKPGTEEITKQLMDEL